jgi:DNA-binding transcriptional regulator YhcF (GntR family)
MAMRPPAISDSPVPAYQQIVDWLRTLLISGKLKPGTTLPSVRSMASDVGVHFNTVAAEYRTLADEGWLDLKQGRGAIVLERTLPKADRETVEEFRQRLRSLVAFMRASGVPVSKLRAELHAAADDLKS